MEEVITQLGDIDLDVDILVTLESLSGYNILGSKKIVVPDDLFENEDLEESTRFHFAAGRKVLDDAGKIREEFVERRWQ